MVDASKVVSFIMSSIIDRLSFMVAVFFGGIFSVLVRLLREKFELLLSLYLG